MVVSTLLIIFILVYNPAAARQGSRANRGFRAHGSLCLPADRAERPWLPKRNDTLQWRAWTFGTWREAARHVRDAWGERRARRTWLGLGFRLGSGLGLGLGLVLGLGLGLGSARASASADQPAARAAPTSACAACRAVAASACASASSVSSSASRSPSAMSSAWDHHKG